MVENKGLEDKVRTVIRPVFTKFEDEELIENISQRIIRKALFVNSLENNYFPMSEIVENFYQELEQDLIFFKQTLLQNQQRISDILRTTSLEDEKYKIMKKVAEWLLIKDAQKYYTRFGLQKPLFALEAITSFSSIRKIIEERETEIGIAIGPEGFMYASIFELYDFPLRNVHIDEYCTTEDRPYKELDDLSIIRGKNIILIEDDVRTGKTLEKACSQIKRHSPKSISLYLGHPERMQNLPNIPKEFRKVYTTPDILSDAQIKSEIDKALEMLKKKYPIFKEKKD